RASPSMPTNSSRRRTWRAMTGTLPAAQPALALRGRYVVPQQSVDEAVSPLAAAKDGLPQHPLAAEPAFLQGLLLGHVVGLGEGADPVGRSGGEQVVHEQALGGGAESSAPIL